MNKKVLKTMIALVVIFLVALYVLKIFFPEEFVMAIETEGLITIGNYIDSHTWASILMGFTIGVIFDCLYFGAVCQTMKLKWYLFLIILGYNIAYSCFFFLAPPSVVAESTNVVICVSTVYMILLPAMFTRNLIPLSITYSVNYVSQSLSLSIRDIGLLMINANSLIITVMSLECYLWMFLLFLLFNYKKGGNNKWDSVNHSTEKA